MRRWPLRRIDQLLIPSRCIVSYDWLCLDVFVLVAGVYVQQSIGNSMKVNTRGTNSGRNSKP
jgi:hypothetical protein